MTNIIKETLEKTFNELQNQQREQEALRTSELAVKANNIASEIDEMFKEFTVNVSDTEITFKYVNDGWNDFRVSRNINYKADGQTYGEASINSGSSSSTDEKALKRYICLGRLAHHCFYKTESWKNLVQLMDRSNEIYLEKIGPISKQLYKISDELRKIEREEQNQTFQTIFNKNTFKLNKECSFYYGSGKWDRVYSDEFFWEENKGGKTYTVSYMDSRRTNPHYDENGNSVEPIYERVKRDISKRVKKADIESFVHHNIPYIEK